MTAADLTANEIALSQSGVRRRITGRTMRHLILDIRKGFHRTLEAHGKFKSERLKLAQDLLEARARIETAGEEGDIGWWAWFEKTFPQSRSDAEHLLAIASADNPQAAYEADKAKTAARVRAHRERRALHVTSPCNMDGQRPIETDASVDGRQMRGRIEPGPERQDIIDEIKALYEPLSRSDRRHCANQLREMP
jgi:hypothetical protein